MLIGNDLHYKSIKTNIARGTLPYIILLYGDYGTGKTHLAKEIARFILCPTECRACSICEGVFSSDTFSTNVSLTNMAKVDQEKARQLLKENVDVFTQETRVFIYDEFHMLSRPNQELWLAETAKLDNTYLVLTTTNLSKIDNGIKSRALKIKMNPLSLAQSTELLKSNELFVNEELAKIIHQSTKGIPRDSLILANYVKNAGLDDTESILLINNQSKPPVDILVKLRDTPEDFLKLLKEIDTDFTKDEIITFARDVLWDELLGRPDASYHNKLISALMQIDKNHLAALIGLASRSYVAKEPPKEQLQAKSVNSHPVRKEIDSW